MFDPADLTFVRALALGATLVFPALLIVAAVHDIRRYLIPNWISLALVGGFVVTALVGGFPFQLYWQGAVASVVLFTISVVPWLFGMLGGADVKLNAAVGLWVGFSGLFPYLFLMVMAGGVVGLVLIALRRAPFAVRLRNINSLSLIMSPEKGIPYGVAIALGGAAVYPQLLTSWF